MNSSTAQSLLVRNVILVLCVALPWLNPFVSSPSTAVIPLLVSWMMAACALLAVVELPLAKPRWTVSEVAMCGVLLAWLVASMLWVPQVVDRALTMGLLASLMCVWLMAGVGRRAAVDESLLRWLVVGILAAAVTSAVLGVLQYLGLARELAPWVNQPLKGDAFANLRQRNQFASLTSLGLVALLGWVAVRTKAQRMTRVGWTLTFVLLNVLAAGVACSVSRTGAVQWALVGVLMAAWGWCSTKQEAAFGKGLVWLALAAPVLVALWSVWMPLLALQTTGEQGASMILRVTGQAQDYAACGGRRVLWSNVLALVTQHPWLGWGWGETDYAHFMTDYNILRFCDMLDNAHDFPLHLALEFGVPFALAVMALICVWVLRRTPWREQHAWRVMAWCLLLVLGLHSLLEYPLWYGPFQMTLGLAIGVLWAAPDAPAREEAQEGPMLVAALLFIGCLYAAWDFNRVGQIYRQAASRDAAYRDNPLHHAKQSWLFKNQADFAELTTQTVTTDNAAELYPQALRLMHYSPEARVVQRVIDSSKLLGHDAQAQALTERLDDVKQSQPNK
ncbi:Wzy polymerase domain-containing protein [Limnohabitans sp. TEGF004]|uniref:PglL family O-oligosaccharyltransferase n=1 Tax=Limnohabitans sp. TEGF004 TaxID=2986281 RepID=UPI00248F70C6|nr:Wzy polymerase domain-containing protein [Limnohabitans sp. TEGF004]